MESPWQSWRSCFAVCTSAFATYDAKQVAASLRVGTFAASIHTVAAVDKLRLFVNVPEAFGPFLNPGLTTDVTVPQLMNRHFNFQLPTVAKGFDVGTRTATTVFTIENEDRALRLGSYAQVHLTTPIGR